MNVVVLTETVLKEELLFGLASNVEGVVWIEDAAELYHYQNADAIIDLVFEEGHLFILQQFRGKLIVINSVVKMLAELDSSYVRINGWPSFLRSHLVEASTINESNKKPAEEIFSLFNKKLEWLPDSVGFVTPRVVSMIINEAFISLREGVSTREEIDQAMKLATNYPYGPFEWSDKIGIEKIESLLKRLGHEPVF